MMSPWTGRGGFGKDLECWMGFDCLVSFCRIIIHCRGEGLVGCGILLFGITGFATCCLECVCSGGRVLIDELLC